MKTLIIENQYDVDPEIHGFVRDNRELFSKVTEMINAHNRDPEEVISKIVENEAIIVKSTFMDKEQLEQLTGVLALMRSKEIFIFRFEDQVKEWLSEDFEMPWPFEDFEKFKENIRECFKNHNVYSFYEALEHEIKDDIWENMEFAYSDGRGRFIYKEIQL